MRFSEDEKRDTLNYITEYLVDELHIKIQDAKIIVDKSGISRKNDESPIFIAHCSIEQLADLVLKNSGLVRA